MVYAPTANGHVQNFGLIRSGNSNAGSTFGVVVNGGNARVENFGTIPTSTQVGAGVNLATIGIGALGSRVENHGLIPGFAESVKGSAPGDLLITAGVLVGLADLAGGHDFYDGTGGSGDDTLRGGDLDDQSRGDAGNDTLAGFAGADQLAGGDGDDRITGNGSDDALVGGIGNDRLSGGGR